MSKGSTSIHGANQLIKWQAPLYGIFAGATYNALLIYIQIQQDLAFMFANKKLNIPEFWRSYKEHIKLLKLY